jgi:hypothetical protein
LGQMPDGLCTSALGDRQHTPLRGVGGELQKIRSSKAMLILSASHIPPQG